ncbi:MAG: hypothetical protein E5V27_21020, partial [Mesorhizobium sp.]
NKIDPPRQLPLDLGHGTGYSRDELVVSGTNSQTVALVDRWPDWPTKNTPATAATMVQSGQNWTKATPTASTSPVSEPT